MIAPSRWTDEQLQVGIEVATGIFRRERMHEPLGRTLTLSRITGAS